MIKAEEAIATVLRVLQKHDVPLNKVVLHKFTYFLETQGLRVGFRFEPWTYGPFSFDLADKLNDMVFWDRLKESNDNNRYEVVDISGYGNLNQEAVRKIDNLAQEFKKIIGKLTFDNLECFGTTLYCAEIVAFQGNEITQDRVVKEFQAWKGKKYSEDRIKRSYESLKPYFSFS